MSDSHSQLIRIGVDARPLSSPLSGVSRVISRVIKHFPDPERYMFLLYSNRGWHPDFSDIVGLPNVIWVQGRGVTSRKAGLWFNLTLPAILRKSHIDLFWGSQQVIPPLFPRALPVVLTYYDLVLYLFPRAMRFLARLQQRAFQKYSVSRADYILSISRQTQEDMILKFGFPKEKASVALLGYEPPKESGKKSAISMDYPWFVDPYILSVSTIEPRKNYGTLLDAYEQYLETEREKPYPLVIAGRRGWETEEFYRKLERVQRETGLVHVVEGATDEELEQLYRNCAFFTLPSLYEGFGLPLLEALAAGKYAIASDVGCLHEIGGDWIRYVSSQDSSGWAQALRETVKLHRDRKLKRIPFPLEEWSWSRTAAIHRAAFDRVLELRSVPAGAGLHPSEADL